MDLSIEALIQGQGTSFIEGEFQHTFAHLGATRLCWILVEGEKDKLLYSKLFDFNDTIVQRVGYVAKDGYVRGGKVCVLNLIESINRIYQGYHVCGIIDLDYYAFEQQQVSYPSNIFLTDKRDLEMTLLSIPSVQNQFKEWLSSETTKFSDISLNETQWTTILQICQFMGEIYVTDTWFCYKYKKGFKNSLYWNMRTHSFYEERDWRHKILQYHQDKVENCTCQTIDDFEEKLIWAYNNFDLRNRDWTDYCRGHDFFCILSNSLIHVDCFSESILVNKMIDICTKNDFKNNELCQNIIAWHEVCHG